MGKQGYDDDHSLCRGMQPSALRHGSVQSYHARSPSMESVMQACAGCALDVLT